MARGAVSVKGGCQVTVLVDDPNTVPMPLLHCETKTPWRWVRTRAPNHNPKEG